MGIRILMLAPMRLSSTRIDSKPLANIGGRFLSEYSIELMKGVSKRYDLDVGLLVGEEELEKIANCNSIKVYPRSQNSCGNLSIKDMTVFGLFSECVDMIREYDILWYYNPCFPFLQISSFQIPYAASMGIHSSYMTARRRFGWIWKAQGDKLFGFSELHTTANGASYLVPDNILRSIPVSTINDAGDLTFPTDPLELSLEEEEYLDIDTPGDLRIARAYAESMGI
jgi:hypothetical protein